MKIQDLLLEAREAPLYHFTTEANVFQILANDTLRAGGPSAAHGEMQQGGRIYFTRDYGRQFVPGMAIEGSWGFRVNQEKLREKFGKKLHAGGQTRWTEPMRQAWLADPANADIIAKVKSGELRGSLTMNGADVRDIVSGNIGKAARWESEEWLDVDALPDFHKYITGIVFSGGSGKKDYSVNYGSRAVDVDENLDEFVAQLISHFNSPKMWPRRDALMKWMMENSVPFVYKRRDYGVRAVKNRMFEIIKQRKADKSAEQFDYLATKNTAGGGIMTSAPTNDPIRAAQWILKNKPEKFPNGMFAITPSGGAEIQFREPYKNSRELPQAAE